MHTYRAQLVRGINERARPRRAHLLRPAVAAVAVVAVLAAVAVWDASRDSSRPSGLETVSPIDVPSSAPPTALAPATTDDGATVIVGSEGTDLRVTATPSTDASGRTLTEYRFDVSGSAPWGAAVYDDCPQATVTVTENDQAWALVPVGDEAAFLESGAPIAERWSASDFAFVLFATDPSATSTSFPERPCPSGN
jgi:hypothetical protein